MDTEQLANKGAASPQLPLFPLVLLYCLTLASVFAVKQKTLVDGGYRIVSRLAGASNESLGWLSALHLYARDIWLWTVVLPLLLLAVARIAGRNACARVLFGLALVYITLSFMSMNALGATGRFLSADQIPPLLTWVREQPGAVFDYVSPRALVKFAVLIGVAIFAYAFRAAQPFRPLDRVALLPVPACAGAALLAGYAALADPVPRTRFHSPVTVQMVASLFGSDPIAASQAELAKVTAHLAYTCGNNQVRAGAGKLNFVLFIMETVPYELFSSARADELPNFTELARSAYVADKHYSTYPFTSYARFSIFTGLYPSYRLEKTLPIEAAHRYRSAFRSLADDGYALQVFDPVLHRYPIDDWVVRQVGGQVAGPDRDGSIAQRDQLVLDRMLGGISDAARDGTPFAYAYMPQLTHGPWLGEGASKQQLYEEGRARLRQLDKGLGAIVASLKEHALYQNTVILITADHGLRTRKEAAFLKPEVLNEVSYHVPLIIHDPALGKQIRIGVPTSHLDISPTLQCLYAPRREPIETQGIVMTRAAAGARPIFFGGAWYNGSDGMWDGKSFYSYNEELDMLWKSPEFEFNEGRPASMTDGLRQVVHLIEGHQRTQEALLGRR